MQILPPSEGGASFPSLWVLTGFGDFLPKNEVWKSKTIIFPVRKSGKHHSK
jgi:hypothetical protein